jgi:hypothetical protein
MYDSDSSAQPNPGDLLRRVVDSAKSNLDRWRDGEGIDLDAIDQSTGDERAQIESFLLSRGLNDPGDVPALARFDSPRTRALFHSALRVGSPDLRAAVLHHAGQALSEPERTRVLIELIQTCDAYAGLDATLAVIEAFHPMAVIHAMLARIATTAGVAPVHFAAMLLYLHEQASEPFDWNHRPFFLRFNTTDLAERRAALSDLCARISIAPEPWLSRIA